MADPTDLEALLASLPDEQATVLRCRLGLDGHGKKGVARAAETLGIHPEEYLRIENAAILAIRGGSTV